MLDKLTCVKCSDAPSKLGGANWCAPDKGFWCKVCDSTIENVSKDLPPDECPFKLEHVMAEYAATEGCHYVHEQEQEQEQFELEYVREAVLISADICRQCVHCSVQASDDVKPLGYTIRLWLCKAAVAEDKYHVLHDGSAMPDCCTRSLEHIMQRVKHE